MSLKSDECFRSILPYSSRTETILLLCHQFCREPNCSIWSFFFFHFDSRQDSVSGFLCVLISSWCSLCAHVNEYKVFQWKNRKKNKKVFQPFVSASHFHLAFFVFSLHESLLIPSIYSNAQTCVECTSPFQNACTTARTKGSDH